MSVIEINAAQFIVANFGIRLEQMFYDIVFWVFGFLPVCVNPQPALLSVLLVYIEDLVPDVDALRTSGSATVDPQVPPSYPHLCLDCLLVPRIFSSRMSNGVAFGEQSIFMVSINMWLLKLLDVWVYVFIRKRAHAGGRALNTEDGFGRPSTGLNNSGYGASLDHVAILQANIMFVGGIGRSEVSADSPSAASFGT